MTRLAVACLAFWLPVGFGEPVAAAVAAAECAAGSVGKCAPASATATPRAEAGVVLLQLQQAGLSRQAATASQDPAVGEELTALKGQLQELQARMDAWFTDLDNRMACCDPCGTSGGAVSTTTTTTTPPVSLCAAFGDPHFITFDGAHTTFVGDHVLWLVKSKTIWIQMLSKDSDGKLKGLAVGGDVMRGHTLTIHKFGTDIHAAFDGSVILNRTVDEFHYPGFFDSYRAETWQEQLHNGQILALRTRAKFDIGPWPSRFTAAPEGGLFLFRWPGHMELTLTGVDYISAVLAMSPQAGGQGGYCGNFNGNPDDDAEPIVPSWDKPIGPDLEPVPDAENLFLHSAGAALLGFSVKSGAGNAATPAERSRMLLDMQRRFAECPTELKAEAERHCAQLLDARIRQDCVFDACMSGDLKTVDGAFAADILEEAVNAKGIPTFLGHGECLDQHGKRYLAYGTHARTDEACLKILRQLATVRGVLGAQLMRGAVCQVLVEQGTDPTGTLVPGGWGEVETPNEVGIGLISGSTMDASWNCWQLN